MALAVNVKVGAELLATRCCSVSGIPRLRVLAGSGYRVAPLDDAKDVQQPRATLRLHDGGGEALLGLRTSPRGEATRMSLVSHEARHGPAV